VTLFSRCLAVVVERAKTDTIFPMRKFLIAAALAASACAPKVVVPAPAVTTPRFPDFIRPATPPAAANTPAAINADRGWAFLQNGDLKTAEREFNAVLKNDPAFAPAEALFGYLELARRDAKAALAHFDRAVEQQRPNVSVLVGRGQALLALGRQADAIAAFESALAADSNLVDIRRRVDVLKFRASEEVIANARQAARAGRLDEAALAYADAIASSPESPFLYRELAAIERQQSKTDAALDHYRQAVALDPTDARSLVQIGDILDGRGEFDLAVQAYSEAAGLEPGTDLDKKIEDTRGRAALARLPAEYRAISDAPQVTRADLAALIGIRLGRLLQGSQRADAVLITDVRNSWAQTWIQSVARAGVIEPFANHQFQPRAIVRRADLAQAMARLLARVAAQRPGAAKAWESARLRFSDLAPSHLAYPAASVAVAAGVIKNGPENAFQPSRPVTGQEAIDAVSKVEALAAGQ
jgi:tetratricopeptide (TPR) repeat protein